MRDFLSCFKEKKPVIGMIHMKGTDDRAVLERAKREIELYIENGVDGIIVETYFGNYNQVEKELNYIKESGLPIPYGVNCLNVDAMGFELANQYDCRFIQIDSVVGHVKPRDEASLEAFFRVFRSRCKAKVMGGVRFKYQPVLSEKSVEEDLIIAMDRCDAICVTEEATGQETSLSKIFRFRRAIGDFPLIVCAGVTPENVAAQMEYADGVVVGSYFKDTFKDSGEVCKEHIRELMAKVKRIREEG